MLQLKNLITLFLFLTLSFHGFSQDSLLVKDTQTNKIRVFKPGYSFLLITKDVPVYRRVKILEIKDSTILFSFPEDDTLSEGWEKLSDITEIRKATKLHTFAYGLGAVFMVNGAAFILEGNNIVNNDNAIVGRGIGVISFGLGLTPFLMRAKTYEIGDRYKLETRVHPKENE